MHQLGKCNKTHKSHITNTQESQEDSENVKTPYRLKLWQTEQRPLVKEA